MISFNSMVQIIEGHKVTYGKVAFFVQNDSKFLKKTTYIISFRYKSFKLKIMNKDKPMCQCGNTSNENGYCDGSHNK